MRTIGDMVTFVKEHETKIRVAIERLNPLRRVLIGATVLTCDCAVCKAFRDVRTEVINPPVDTRQMTFQSVENGLQ